jgi:hypothetical protein
MCNFDVVNLVNFATKVQNLKLLYYNNEPKQHDPSLINETEQIYSNHLDKELRACKLLGIYFDDTLTLDGHHTPYSICYPNSINFLA